MTKSLNKNEKGGMSGEFFFFFVFLCSLLVTPVNMNTDHIQNFFKKSDDYTHLPFKGC